MKNLYRPLFAFIAAATVLTSCSDDDSSGTNNGNIPATGTYINAKVDGQQFETMSIQGYTTGAAAKTGVGEQTYITISASSENTNTMVITMAGVDGEGTYLLGPDSETFVAFADMGTETTYHSSADCANVSGELKVTHFSDDKIEGTFTYTGADDDCNGTRNVTNGKFRGIYMQR